MHFYLVYLMRIKEKTKTWKKKKRKKSIIKDRQRRILESPRVTRDFNWAKLVAQLNELIQHPESDFAMFYHKDKDKWIALVLSNWILGAFDE